MPYTYYKITDRHANYKGESFFRVNDNKAPVVKVTLGNGDNNKGRIGIYYIAYVSFTSNYYFPNHSYNNVELCDEKLFYDKMKEAIKKLLL